MNINVLPSPYVRPSVNITSVQIRVINLDLFKCVSINATLMSNDNYVDSKQFQLEGTDYTNWGNDDSYIINYVLNQLGLSQSTTSVAV